jgi:GNAT superfamily N-acetyltransferase
VGCIALRPLDEPLTGEVKRLYVRPSARGTGLGRALVETVLSHARTIGYRELRLDTADWMGDALRLYARLGFRERPPYYHNPMPGVVYMSITL